MENNALCKQEILDNTYKLILMFCLSDKQKL